MWLKDTNATLRTFDATWMKELSQFIEKTLSVVKEANLLSSQGGPIVMLQIENEYGNMESYYGTKGQQYVKWLSDYALSLDVGGVPWIMCQQGEGTGSAPDATIINACNGFYCDNWISGHAHDFPQQPHMWTENWPGWFQNWGEPIPHRPAVDVAFAVARWFARGGSYMNYYMSYGGSTFGRKVGGPLIVTSYDYDVMLNEFALPAEPKYSLLKSLHQVLMENADTLLGQLPPDAMVLSSDNHCETHLYRSDNSHCLAFYSNWGDESQACSIPAVDGSGSIVTVPAWSVSIAAGNNCSELRMNTKDTAADIKANQRSYTPVSNFKLSSVEAVSEPVPSMTASTAAVVATTVSSSWPLEQLSLTKDSTDFLWYSTSIPAASTEEAAVSSLKISFDSGTAGGAVFHVFLDGQHVASSYGAAGGNPIVTATANNKHNSAVDAKHPDYYPPSPVSFTITLPVGYDSRSADNKLDILSLSMGLKNYGPYLEAITVGIMSNVTAAYYAADDQIVGEAVVLQGFNHTVGLQGEQQWLGASSTKTASSSCSAGTLCWYRATFPSPNKRYTLIKEDLAFSYALNLGSAMGKGQAWVNGHMLGRYWNITGVATTSQRSCQDTCASNSYVGSYNGDRCRDGCGQPSQEYYKLPVDWLRTDGTANELVLLEELENAADLNKLMLFEVKMTSV